MNIRSRMALAVTAVLLTTAAPAETYRVTALNVPDSAFNMPSGINTSGRVVGWATYPTDDEETYAFSWTKNTGALELGQPSEDGGYVGGNSSGASAINNRGQVVGHSFGLAVMWGPVGIQLFCPRVPVHGRLGGALGINNAGVVVGYCDRLEEQSFRYPFIWSRANGLQILPAPAGFSQGRAHAINSSNEVVGVVYEGQGPTQAVRWDRDHVPQLLSTRTGTEYSAAYAINKNGVTVGYAATGNGTVGLSTNAVLWDVAGIPTYLGDLQGGQGSSEATSINNRAQVVGTSGDAFLRGHAFIWDQLNGMRDLNALLNPDDPIGQNLTVTRALAINDLGQIAVTGDDKRTADVEMKAFLLKPVK